MPTLNYTTSVPAGRTVSEVQGLLAAKGASAVATRYEQGRAVGLSFALPTPHGERSFTLPVNVEGVHQLLLGMERAGEFRRLRKAAGTFTSREHAERVAWRVMKDWVAAQVAIIEAQMASLDEVFLPYLQVEQGRTLYEAYREREQLAIESGGVV